MKRHEGYMKKLKLPDMEHNRTPKGWAALMGEAPSGHKYCLGSASRKQHIEKPYLLDARSLS
jgi:hypothetical protein